MKTIVAVGPFAWGKSVDGSIDRAVRECKKRVPRSYLTPGRHEIHVFEVEDFQEVDGLGRIVSGQRGGIREIAVRHLIVR